ncbi:hypothetical protein BKA82DRAFT_541629 [Pisolithus tinctorius]|uniref:Uncharacterized protein n=1 Tax=Pisolithus tinctorius Marx 270 TaxID=870435 RepID=A0A0C3K5P0_PISTI|nr:hypothetical protein BKA82DRAFT_541629 [Pisolithus tinctorius]KIO04867.1 hypothetical protein M404DRAFT_541629 [Pisolithus tinctorius Marx 270]
MPFPCRTLGLLTHQQASPVAGHPWISQCLPPYNATSLAIRTTTCDRQRLSLRDGGITVTTTRFHPSQTQLFRVDVRLIRRTYRACGTGGHCSKTFPWRLSSRQRFIRARRCGDGGYFVHMLLLTQSYSCSRIR